jgi:hypothetical protein
MKGPSRMNFGLHAIRRRQTALLRTVLALFALVWLQVAMVPCVMAADGLTARFGGGSTMMSDGPAATQADHGCPYCPPSETHSGAADTAGCSYQQQPQLDARGGSPLFIALPVTAVLVFAAMPLVLQRCQSSTGDPPPPRDPLAIVYCRLIE